MQWGRGITHRQGVARGWPWNISKHSPMDSEVHSVAHPFTNPVSPEHKSCLFSPILYCAYWSGTETSCWNVAAAVTESTNCQLKPILKDCRFDQHRQWMLTSEAVWGRMHKLGTNGVHRWILSDTCVFICKCRVVMRWPEESVDVASLRCSSAHLVASACRRSCLQFLDCCSGRSCLLFFSSRLRRCVLQPAVHNQSRGVLQALKVNMQSCGAL